MSERGKKGDWEEGRERVAWRVRGWRAVMLIKEWGEEGDMVEAHSVYYLDSVKW